MNVTFAPNPTLGLPIAAPPWNGAGRLIEGNVRKALYHFNMLEGVDKLVVALSGGKDSLSLLYMLHAISGRGFPSFELYAVHVGGEFSCGAGVQEQFLQAICDHLHVPLIRKESTQKLETLECYRCSRERRRLIFDAAKEVGARTIAFGHHRDDSIQTLLLNLLQKGEFAGNLAKIAMHDYGVTIIRPLIYLSEDEIRKFAQLYGFSRITCQCPVGQDSMRKKVDQLITEMELLFPHVRSNLAHASLVYGSDKAAKKTSEPG